MLRQINLHGWPGAGRKVPAEKQLQPASTALRGAMLPKRTGLACLIAEFGQCFQRRTLAEDNYGRRGNQPAS